MAETIVEESESMVLRMENGASSVKDDVSSISSMRTPLHPMPQLQGPFDESMLESLNEAPGGRSDKVDAIARRSQLLQNEKYERIVAGRWKQRPGEKYHPLWKLTAQLSFGMHLLAQNLAKSEEDVMRILQSHVDDIDSFLEGTSEDFDLAQADIHERLRYLKLPLEHGDTFERMLQDRSFRSSIIEGNEKIEHIIDRTSEAMKDSLKDIQKAVDATAALSKYLQTLRRDWHSKSPEVEAVYHAMLGNVNGWSKALGSLQWKGKRLGVALVQLSGVIIEMAKRVAAVSKASLGSSPHASRPQSRLASKSSSPEVLTPNGLKTSFSVDKPLPTEPETPKPVRQITIVKRQKSQDQGFEPRKSSDLAVPEIPPSTPRTKLQKRKSSQSLSRSRSRPSLDRDRTTTKSRTFSLKGETKSQLKNRQSSPNLASPSSDEEIITLKKRQSSPNINAGLQQRSSSSNAPSIPSSPDPRNWSLSQRTKSLTKRISSGDFARKKPPFDGEVRRNTHGVEGKEDSNNTVNLDTGHNNASVSNPADAKSFEKKSRRKSFGDRTRSLTRRIAAADVLAKRSSRSKTSESRSDVPPVPATIPKGFERSTPAKDQVIGEQKSLNQHRKGQTSQNQSLTNRISRGDLLDLRKKESEDQETVDDEEMRVENIASGAANVEEGKSGKETLTAVDQKAATTTEPCDRTLGMAEVTEDVATMKAASDMVTKNHNMKKSLENIVLENYTSAQPARQVRRASSENIVRPSSSRLFSLSSKMKRPSFDNESLRPGSSKSSKVLPSMTAYFTRNHNASSKIERLGTADRTMSMPSTLRPIDAKAPRVPSPDVSLLKGQSFHEFIGLGKQGRSEINQTPVASGLPAPNAGRDLTPTSPPRSPYSLFPSGKDRSRSPHTHAKRSAPPSPGLQPPRRNPTFTSHPPDLPLATPTRTPIQEGAQASDSQPESSAEAPNNSKIDITGSKATETAASVPSPSATPIEKDVKKDPKIASDSNDSGLGSSPTEGYFSSPSSDVFYTPIGSLPTSATLPPEVQDSSQASTIPPAGSETAQVTFDLSSREDAHRVYEEKKGSAAVKSNHSLHEDAAATPQDLHSTKENGGSNSLGKSRLNETPPDSTANGSAKLPPLDTSVIIGRLRSSSAAKERKRHSQSDVPKSHSNPASSSASSSDLVPATKRFSVPLPHQMKDSDWMSFVPVSGDELSSTSPVSPTHLADLAIPRSRPRMGDRSLRRSFPSYKRLSDAGLGTLNPVKEEVDPNIVPERNQSADWRTRSSRNKDKRMSQIKRRPVSEVFLRDREALASVEDTGTPIKMKARPRSLQLHAGDRVHKDLRVQPDSSIAAIKSFNRRSAPLSIYSLTATPGDASRDPVHPIEEALQRLLIAHESGEGSPKSRNQVKDALKALSGEGDGIKDHAAVDEAYKRLTATAGPEWNIAFSPSSISGDRKALFSEPSLKGRASLPSQVQRRHRSLSASDSDSLPSSKAKLSRSGAQKKRHSIAGGQFPTLASNHESMGTLTSTASKGTHDPRPPAATQQRRHSWLEAREAARAQAAISEDQPLPQKLQSTSQPSEKQQISQATISGTAIPPFLPPPTNEKDPNTTAPTTTVTVSASPPPPPPPPSARDLVKDPTSLFKRLSSKPSKSTFHPRPSSAGAGASAKQASSTSAPPPPPGTKKTKIKTRLRTASLGAKTESGRRSEDITTTTTGFSVSSVVPMVGSPPPPPSRGSDFRRKMSEPGEMASGKTGKKESRRSWWRKIVPGVKAKGRDVPQSGAGKEVAYVDVPDRRSHEQRGDVFRGMGRDGKWVRRN
ncbi:MAG: hypothetical protein Q9227_002096 [Pyrenula ochraceoflavens]